MIVYRFENVSHQGPYTACTSRKWGIISLGDLAEMQPSPRFAHDETLQREYLSNGSLLFGFRDMLQAQKWWAKHQIEAMIEDGFYLAVYDIDRKDVFVPLDKKQLTFLDRDQKPFARRPVGSLTQEDFSCATPPWVSESRSAYLLARSGSLSPVQLTLGI